MPDQEQFGPRLRREREKRRISLEEIADATNVAVDLWEALEQNDFSRWPSGIFARAFVRDYARIVGLDPDAVVDEFCRHFTVADRRGTRLLEAHAELIGHQVDATDGAEPLPAGRERRRGARRPAPPTHVPLVYRPRAIAGAIDALGVGVIGALASALTGRGFWECSGLIGLAYFTAGTVLLGRTPGIHVLDLLRHRAPSLFASRRAINV